MHQKEDEKAAVNKPERACLGRFSLLHATPLVLMHWSHPVESCTEAIPLSSWSFIWQGKHHCQRRHNNKHFPAFLSTPG